MYPVAVPAGIDESTAFLRMRSNIHDRYQRGPYCPFLSDCVVSAERAIRAEGLMPPSVSHGTVCGFDPDQWVRDKIDQLVPDPTSGTIELVKEIEAEYVLEEFRSKIGWVFGFWGY